MYGKKCFWFRECSLIIFWILVWGSGTEATEDELDRLVAEVLSAFGQKIRAPRSNGSSNEKVTTVPPPSTVYNYWLLPTISTRGDTIRSVGQSSTESGLTGLNYWLSQGFGLLRTTMPANLDKLKDEIRYKSLAKSTNEEFLAYLEKQIQDKKTELNEEEKEIKEGYEELNRTREALFQVYNGRRRRGRSRLDMLRKRLAEKEVVLDELMSLHRGGRISRDLIPDVPWVNIRYPGGTIEESMRMKKSQESHETTTMNFSDILWKSLRKYVPFTKRGDDELEMCSKMRHRFVKEVEHASIEQSKIPQPIPFFGYPKRQNHAYDGN